MTIILLYYDYKIYLYAIKHSENPERYKEGSKKKLSFIIIKPL